MTQDQYMAKLVSENERMKDLLVRRPAVNSGLIEAYIQWNVLVYISDRTANEMYSRMESEIH